MPENDFYVTVLYRKDANFMLSRKIDGSLRTKLSFGGLFDMLSSQVADHEKMDEKDAKMVRKLDQFRKDSIEGMRQELQQGRVIEGQHEITLDACVSENPPNWEPVQTYDKRLDGGRGRYTADLERPIARYVKLGTVTLPETGKTTEINELRVLFDYIIVVGNE